MGMPLVVDQPKIPVSPRRDRSSLPPQWRDHARPLAFFAAVFSPRLYLTGKSPGSGSQRRPARGKPKTTR
ncbi:hypothetical protein, partial [Rhodospirillum rubrum]|uniref:hypothetical protein n=1 Tax=Rhodospirillum rubrum TaxID=1085 RepID=UPI0028A822A6